MDSADDPDSAPSKRRNAQPPGCVILADRHSRTILEISTNAEQLLARSPHHLLGTDASVALPGLEEFWRSIGSSGTSTGPIAPAEMESILRSDANSHDQPVSVLAHGNADTVVIEIEPADGGTSPGIPQLFQRLTTSADRLAASSLASITLRELLEEFTALTGYREVAVMNRAADSTRHVLAERGSADRHGFVDPGEMVKTTPPPPRS